MSLHKKLEAMVDGMPPGSLITLSVDWLSREMAVDARQDPEELLTLEDVASRDGRVVSTVRTWCNSGKLPGAFRLNGRDWRVPAQSLTAWRESQQNPTPKAASDPPNDDIGSWRRVRKGRAP
jgi:hypothetical protein